jgi:hypothetical protein
MAFQDGHKKIGGRRPKTPNKRTLKLIEILEQHGYNPVAELIEWAVTAKTEYARFNDIIERFEQAQQDAVDRGEPSPRMPDISEAHTWARLGIHSALGILPFIYPKRKPAEGQDDVTPEQAEAMTTDQLLDRAEKYVKNFRGNH